MDEPDLVAEQFVTSVLIPYLSEQADPDEVGVREVVALLSGFQVGSGRNVSPVHLDVAVWRRLRLVEPMTTNAGESTKLLILARKLSQQLLRVPARVLSPD